MKKLLIGLIGLFAIAGCEFEDPDPVVKNFGTVTSAINVAKDALENNITSMFTDLEIPADTQDKYAYFCEKKDAMLLKEAQHYFVLGLSVFDITLDNDNMEDIVISEHEDGNCTVSYTTSDSLSAVATFETSSTYASLVLEIDDEFVFSSEWLIVGDEYAIQMAEVSTAGEYSIIQIYIEGNTGFSARASYQKDVSSAPSSIIGLTEISTTFAATGIAKFIIEENSFTFEEESDR